MAPTIITTLRVPAQPAFKNGGPYDLASLEDVKLELDLDTTRDDRWLKTTITRASDAIAHFCDRRFQVETYEDEFWAYRDPYPWQLPSGFMPLQLRRWPLAAPVCVAGIAPPGHPPALATVAGGALTAARYYVKITYVTAQGETAAGLESDLLVAAGAVLTVASPPLDRHQLAIGWNCYVGVASFAETLQTAAPLPIGTPFTLPAAGLTASTLGLPPYTLVVEKALAPRALAEDRDFKADAGRGQLTRLAPDHYAGHWPGAPLSVCYRAGFAEIPSDLQDACIQLVKARYYGRRRDPMVKSDNVEGIYSADYWYGTGPGGPADMPSYVADTVMRYRVPVIA